MPKVRIPGRRSALLLLAILFLAACGKQADAPEPVRSVRTQTISSADAGMTLEFAGEIRARNESRLGFRVGGKLLSRKVNLGDKVQAGQVLAQLDAQDLNLAQEAAKAAMQAARVNRDQLGNDYKRFIELKEQGFISAAELERRENGFKAAQAQLEQARAQANAQANQAGYAALVSDVSGVVTAVAVDPGTVVPAGQPIINVAPDGPRDLVFSVPEDQVARVRSAAAVKGALRMRVWGEGQAEREVSLREVSAAADPVTRTFLFKADAGSSDIKLGQTATALLSLPKTEQVIKLPLSAVLQTQGATSVWVLDPASMTVKPQPVTVGGADGNEVVIAAGLKPGQEVVVAGVHVLTPGQKVKRFQAAQPPAKS
ncbi:MAG: efflux RND transporter periplasmic adaptor subunit [Paucibacter sp.]|nr:efflux RND transporter periplasmic adaptor subunit [Roseateles sp.]